MDKLSNVIGVNRTFSLSFTNSSVTPFEGFLEFGVDPTTIPSLQFHDIYLPDAGLWTAHLTKVALGGSSVSGDYVANIDTATPWIFIPRTMLHTLFEDMPGAMFFPVYNTIDVVLAPCNSTWPDLDLQLDDKHYFIKSTEYIFNIQGICACGIIGFDLCLEDTSKMFKSTVPRVVLGKLFTMGRLLHFDMNASRIGITSYP